MVSARDFSQSTTTWVQYLLIVSVVKSLCVALHILLCAITLKWDWATFGWAKAICHIWEEGKGTVNEWGHYRYIDRAEFGRKVWQFFDKDCLL